MRQVVNVNEVLQATQRVKAKAVAFRSNMYASQDRVERWIERGELFLEESQDVVFLLRRDGEMGRVFFSATDESALFQAFKSAKLMQTCPTMMDLVGSDAGLSTLVNGCEQSGWGRYAKLIRLIRSGAEQTGRSESGDFQIALAEPGECPAIRELLAANFDLYAEQVPTLDEIELAVAAGQILVARCDGVLGGLIHFETQGYTSSVRFWLVAERFRSRRVGGGLMRRYFEMHGAVRRFVLWVMSANDNAIQKYEHYGYRPDGLVDHILSHQIN